MNVAAGSSLLATHVWCASQSRATFGMAAPLRISRSDGLIGEVAVRLDDHRDAAAFRVLAERAQAVDDPRDRRRPRLAGGDLVAEDAHVGHAETIARGR